MSTVGFIPPKPQTHSRRKHRRRLMIAAVTTVAGLCLGTRPVHADPVNQIDTWTGGAGNGSWSNASNWSPAVVPVNNAQNIYNVIVPNGVNVVYDEPVPTTINGISYGSGGSITLGTGEQLTVSSVAALNSNITATGANTLFNATGTGASVGNSVQLSASAGAVISLSGVSYTFGNQVVENAFSADGAGSVVNVASIATMINTGSSYFESCEPTFTATNGGVIDLSALKSLVGGVGNQVNWVTPEISLSSAHRATLTSRT